MEENTAASMAAASTTQLVVNICKQNRTITLTFRMRACPLFLVNHIQGYVAYRYVLSTVSSH